MKKNPPPPVSHNPSSTKHTTDLEAQILEMKRLFEQLRNETASSMRRLSNQNAKLTWEIQTLRNLKSKLEVGEQTWWTLQEKRSNYDNVPHNPLVSVLISTHNRRDLLLSRSLPSVVKQSYRNLQIIVVCDGCSDGTVESVAKLNDSRIQVFEIERSFPNLKEASRRWMVSGSIPNNFAQEHAEGFYVTHLDDDDEFMPSRIELLVEALSNVQADLVYHPFLFETPEGKWVTNSAPTFDHTHVTTSSIFYKGWLKDIRWDPATHLLLEPADWNRMRRMIYAGAIAIRSPQTLTRHYRERNQSITRNENEQSKNA